MNIMNTEDQIFNGLELLDSNKQLLSFLVKSTQDYDVFIAKFWKSAAVQSLSIMEFHNYKIKERDMSLAEFEHLFGGNQKGALEDLFQRPIDDTKINIIINKIRNEELALSSVFDMGRQGLNPARLTHRRR